ncbi:MAG: DUF3037 domain-containing protein [Chloroflexi bacterium]|nr:DUF3037 domain-containing protein [Chloroflexota bacterium]
MWYSYALIRIVPRVERGGLLNVGVVLFAREQDFLEAAVELDVNRVYALAPGLDIDVVRRHLQMFQSIADGSSEGGPVAGLPASERFHWLVAPRSTVIQTSPVHVGRSPNPSRALDELMEELVRLPAQRAAAASSPGGGA